MESLTGTEKECNKVNVSTKKRAAPVNLHIEQGASFIRSFVYKIDGEAVDLSDAIVRSQFRETYGSPDTVLELSTEDGSLSLVPAEGKIEFIILPNQTKEISVDNGVWDLEIEFSPENIIRLMQGNFFISKEVTR